MTIDWTQPVIDARDMDADPLFDSQGRVQACRVGSVVYAPPAFEKLGLRNVPPPKPEPVLREAWVVWNSEGGRYTPFNSEDDAKDLAERVDGVFARAAAMSDGSPVPGEAAGEDTALARGLMQVEINRLNALLTEARTKAEALNRDLDSRIAECGSAWEKCDAWRTKAEALQVEEEQLREELVRRSAKADDAMAAVQKVKYVVDAAVAWERHFSHQAAERLIEAVRTYQQATKKPAAEAVANVAEMNCTTCRWLNSGFFPPSCKCCSVRDNGLQMNWEPRHD